MAKFANLVKVQDKLLNDLLLKLAQNQNQLQDNERAKQALKQELASLGLTEQLITMTELLQLRRMRETIAATMAKNEAEKQDLLATKKQIQANIKQANLKLEQYKYLADEELKAKRQRQQQQEQKNLDEIATMQFANRPQV